VTKGMTTVHQKLCAWKDRHNHVLEYFVIAFLSLVVIAAMFLARPDVG